MHRLIWDFFGRTCNPVGNANPRRIILTATDQHILSIRTFWPETSTYIHSILHIAMVIKRPVKALIWFWGGECLSVSSTFANQIRACPSWQDSPIVYIISFITEAFRAMFLLTLCCDYFINNFPVCVWIQRHLKQNKDTTAWKMIEFVYNSAVAWDIWTASSETAIPVCAKCAAFTLYCTCAKPHPCICFPMKHSVLPNDYVCAGWSKPSLAVYARRHVFALRGPYRNVFLFETQHEKCSLEYVRPAKTQISLRSLS